MDVHLLIYIAAFLLTAWGVAHLLPTASIVRGFPPLSDDNRRILVMEWIGEGVTLVFIGVLLALVTSFDSDSTAARVVYWTSAIGLNVLSIVSFFTGFRIHFLPFRLCPVIFTGSSLLVVTGFGLS